MELRLSLRNGEYLLVTLGIPVGLLLFFARVPVLPTGDYEALDFLVPGVLALSVFGSAMVGLGIATGFERSTLVLKRLGATPLRRRELIGAKLAAVLLVLGVQVGVLLSVALVLGWRPGTVSSAALAGAGLLLGTAAAAGIGLALAGRLAALLNLAVTNGLFVALLLASGIVFPLAELPEAAARVAQLLPSAALATLLRIALGAEQVAAVSPLWSIAGTQLAVLAAWAVGAPLVAAWSFRWE